MAFPEHFGIRPVKNTAHDHSDTDCNCPDCAGAALPVRPQSLTSETDMKLPVNEAGDGSEQ